MGFCEVSQKRVSPDFRRRHQDALAPRLDSAAPAGVKDALCSACLVAAFVILVWGMTFANARALLEDFSALEILVGRFGLAWVALWGWEICSKLRGRDALLIATASRQPAVSNSIKVARQQCEAVTKSGNRCKRNAVVSGKLCRQHQKIADVKSGKK